jgi:salicylate hydroxylase
MLPYLAQGAAMGLEDAVALAAAFEDAAEPEAALRRFEAARMRRVTRVQRAARANARTFHLAGPAARARNAVLGLGEQILTGALIRRYDWLYGGP